jgi:TonB family protein
MSEVLLNIIATVVAGAVATSSGVSSSTSEASVTRMASDVEVVFAYPRAAYRAHVSGAATVQCVLDERAAVRKCSVVSEQPGGQGFGDAATKLVPYMAFSVPPSTDGAGSVVSFTITFKNPMADKWPNYLRVPSADYLRSVWPRDMTGQVQIGCRVEIDGTPDACEVLEPLRPSAAIRAAAQKVMATIQFSPATRDGRPIQAVAIVPFKF